jgi:hypothetical protein
VVVDEVKVKLRPQCTEAVVIDMYARLEEVKLQAEDDDSGVDKLFALDARDDADDCVVK